MSEFEWIHKDKRFFFTLGPFNLTSKPEEASIRKKTHRGRILISAFAGDGVISRLSKSTEARASVKAQKLSEQTGDPVILAELAGFTGQSEPVYEAIGRVRKAANPLTEEGLEKYIARMAARLDVIAAQEAANITREAMEWFDFNFTDATGRQIRVAQAGLRATVSSPSVAMIRGQQIAMNRVLSTLSQQTGSQMARLPALRGTIGAAFNLPDKRIAQAISQHHGFWVRDQYGRVSQSLASQVRPIIERGVNQGLGRREIARELSSTINGGLQMPGYWSTVAANASVRARSYSQGLSMQMAGITHFRIEAVLDEATTETCLMLHDKLIPLDESMRLQNQLMSDPNPEGVLWHQPFIKDTGDELAVEFPDGTRNVIATIDQRGSGTGSPGTYSNTLGGRDLVSTAVGFPPYHHNCRTTVVAEV